MAAIRQGPDELGSNQLEAELNELTSSNSASSLNFHATFQSLPPHPEETCFTICLL